MTDTADKLSSESRPVVIIFDEAAKILKAQEGSQTYTFGNVSVSNIAISGDVDNLILGIDRSSLGIVWQHDAAVAWQLSPRYRRQDKWIKPQDPLMRPMAESAEASWIQT